MKRCPKCNRTFETDTQKFCTHDGGLLFLIEPALSETMQFDSAKVRDAVAKPTTRDLEAQKLPEFDPEATVVSSRADEGTREVNPRDTGELASPQVTQHHIQTPAATPSGPISPAQTSASSPPPPTPSAPLPAQPAAQPQPSQPLSPARPAKKSKVPLVLGILAVLLVLGIGVAVAAYLVVLKPMLEERRAARPEVIDVRTDPTPGAATPTDVSRPADEAPPYSPPADALQFVNSKENLSGRLLENYIEFSFYYPERWVKVPSAENFIKVERRLPPDFTQENFAVAPWYSLEGSAVADNEFFQRLAAKDDADFAKRFPEYRKISEGPTKVGVYDAYEFRFEGVSRGTDKGDVTLWGREIFFLPRPGEKTGLKFLILTTSLAPELNSADDIGVKGEMLMLLESFRFGKK